MFLQASTSPSMVWILNNKSCVFFSLQRFVTSFDDICAVDTTKTSHVSASVSNEELYLIRWKM